MKTLLAAACLALAAPLAVAQTAAPTVGIVTIAPQPVYQEQSYVGRIQAPEIVALQARVTGYLESQNFKDGQRVHKGDLLYVIEQPPYQAQLAQAQAALAQAKAQDQNAELTLQRATALLRTPAGQQSTVDSARATALSDQAAVLSAQAKLQTAQINLGYTEIRSPVDGIIGATTLNPGNVVGPSAGTLATIVSDDPMYVTFSLPVVDAIHNRANINQLAVIVQLPDGSTYNQTGKIDFINNQVTTNTDTLAWRATIPNPQHTLTDGEFVTVTLRAANAKNELVIPLAAIIDDQLGDYVLTLDPDNVVQRTNITLGQQTNTTAVVQSGLKPGDRVITDGIQRVHPGITVSPEPAGSGA
jgi:membrane fusion protein (multidrug efflux system)